MTTYGGKFTRGSDTSLAAAIANEPNAGTQRRLVWDELRRFKLGLTDHEMQANLSMPGSTQRPRRVELCERQMVRDSGRRRATPRGRMAVVWVAITREQPRADGGANIVMKHENINDGALHARKDPVDPGQSAA